MILLNSVLATFFVSVLSLVGLFTLSIKAPQIKKVTGVLVALAAGTLIGGAFLHLLPEASHEIEIHKLFNITLLSFISFFLIEKILHWRHCHNADCKVHTFGQMNLIGDAFHNFLDGMLIAAAFVTDFQIGVATTLAVSMHELPQEIGDFGVLLHAGYSRKRALLFNFLSAITAILGAVFAYFLSAWVESISTYLLIFAAGGFIYIASADLLPEMRKETNVRKMLAAFFTFLVGVGIMYFFSLGQHEH